MGTKCLCCDICAVIVDLVQMFIHLIKHYYLHMCILLNCTVKRNNNYVILQSKSLCAS